MSERVHNDTTDWKKNYGVIYSYIKGQILLSLPNFIEDMFYNKIHNNFGYPLTPNECFRQKYRLLLLED